VRIARVVSRLNLGGPARQILASDPRLAARGHSVRVFAGTPRPGEGDLFETARAAGVDVVRVPGMGGGTPWTGALRARRFLRRALRELRPDVVHTHASVAGFVGRRAARGLACARVHTFHGHVLEGYFPEPIARAFVGVERRLARETDRLVAVSHATADDLVRLGIATEEQLVVVPPGAELGRLLALERADAPGELRRRLRAGAEAFLVGVLGRLAEVKQPERALAVFELLAARHPHLHVVFVGDGDQRGVLVRRIQALAPPLRERAHLLGAVEDVAPVLAELDAVLLTSRTEGLPVALIEAGAAGLPVVAARVGGVPEVVAEERTGYLGETVDELAFGLDRLVSDPGEARAMGARARLRVEGRHGADRLADSLEQLYASLVEDRACAS
jgi:glycosyltransferase involved in cell wall biosynthesis